MPQQWSRKDEKLYQDVLKSCRNRRRRKGKSVKSCRSIAASTVNKVRAKRAGRCVCPVGYNKRGNRCVKRGKRAGPKTRGMVCPTRKKRKR